jgi:hypothetical protein
VDAENQRHGSSPVEPVDSVLLVHLPAGLQGVAEPLHLRHILTLMLWSVLSSTRVFTTHIGWVKRVDNTLAYTEDTSTLALVCGRSAAFECS